MVVEEIIGIIYMMCSTGIVVIGVIGVIVIRVIGIMLLVAWVSLA